MYFIHLFHKLLDHNLKLFDIKFDNIHVLFIALLLLGTSSTNPVLMNLN